MVEVERGKKRQRIVFEKGKERTRRGEGGRRVCMSTGCFWIGFGQYTVYQLVSHFEKSCSIL